MLTELTAKDKVVGLKQTRRALAAGQAARVFLARDADPHITEPLEAICGLRTVTSGEVKICGTLKRLRSINVSSIPTADSAHMPAVIHNAKRGLSG